MIIHALRLWVSEKYRKPYLVGYNFSFGAWAAGPFSEFNDPPMGREWWDHFNKVLEIDTHDCWPPDYD
jgi:hypothetical protein